jgi:hypothetical protein
MEETKNPAPQPTLNGKPTTQQELEEKRKDAAIRIVEKGEGTGDFRELKKLRG